MPVPCPCRLVFIPTDGVVNGITSIPFSSAYRLVQLPSILDVRIFGPLTDLRPYTYAWNL